MGDRFVISISHTDERSCIYAIQDSPRPPCILAGRTPGESKCRDSVILVIWEQSRRYDWSEEIYIHYPMKKWWDHSKGKRGQVRLEVNCFCLLGKCPAATTLYDFPPPRDWRWRSWKPFLLASYIGRLDYETSQARLIDTSLTHLVHFLYGVITLLIPASLRPCSFTHRSFIFWSNTPLLDALGIVAFLLSPTGNVACFPLTFSVLLSRRLESKDQQSCLTPLSGHRSHSMAQPQIPVVIQVSADNSLSTSSSTCFLACLDDRTLCYLNRPVSVDHNY